jgi:hypothetical protein
VLLGIAESASSCLIRVSVHPRPSSNRISGTHICSRGVQDRFTSSMPTSRACHCTHFGRGCLCQFYQIDVPEKTIRKEIQVFELSGGIRRTRRLLYQVREYVLNILDRESFPCGGDGGEGRGRCVRRARKRNGERKCEGEGRKERRDVCHDIITWSLAPSLPLSCLISWLLLYRC